MFEPVFSTIQEIREKGKKKFHKFFIPLFEKHKDLKKISWRQLPFSILNPDDCLINDKYGHWSYNLKIGPKKVQKNLS